LVLNISRIYYNHKKSMIFNIELINELSGKKRCDLTCIMLKYTLKWLAKRITNNKERSKKSSIKFSATIFFKGFSCV